MTDSPESDTIFAAAAASPAATLSLTVREQFPRAVSRDWPQSVCMSQPPAVPTASPSVTCQFTDRAAVGVRRPTADAQHGPILYACHYLVSRCRLLVSLVVHAYFESLLLAVLRDYIHIEAFYLTGHANAES